MVQLKQALSTAYAMAIQSNESANQAALQFYVVGGASAAVRRFQIQSGEVGVANSGIIEFQPDGGDVRFPNGILFGSDTAAANELDDYEEGTWHCYCYRTHLDFCFDQVLIDQLVAYTKIGELVHAKLEYKLILRIACSGNIKFSLPFTSGNFTDLKCRFWNLWLVNTGETNYDCHMVLWLHSDMLFLILGQIADEMELIHIYNAHVDGAFVGSNSYNV